jgi:hypothetical protein
MSAVPSSPEPIPAPKKSGGMALRVFLFLVLLVMIALFAYDVYGSRASHRAFKSVEAWVDKDEAKTPEDVRKLLGRQPDNDLQKVDHYFRETYSWRRGRLYDARYIVVLYRKEGDKILLHEVVQNVAPEGNDIPDKMPEPPAGDSPPRTTPPTGETGEATAQPTPAEGPEGDEPKVDSPTSDEPESDPPSGESSTDDSSAG